MTQERRGKTRVKIETKVTLYLEGKVYKDCVTRDLSLSGIFVQNSEQPPEGEHCRLDIIYQRMAGEIILTIEGEIVRANQKGVVIRFLNMDPDCYHELQTIVLYNADDPFEVAWEFDERFEK